MQNSAFIRLIFLTALLVTVAWLFSRVQTVVPSIPVPAAPSPATIPLRNFSSPAPEPTITLPPINIRRNHENDD